MRDKHLVILVHGIRDIARWQASISASLRAAGFEVEPTNYGRVNLLEFLLPISYFRNRAINTIWTQMQQAMQLHPRAKVSIIAHSFGTYVVAKILEKQFILEGQIQKIIFCGSVVRYNFPFEQFKSRFQHPIVNEVGTADPWPALAESVTTSFGSAGTFGFRRPGVRDRFHNGAGHGYFLTSEFCSKYWVGLLEGKPILEGDIPARDPPLWVLLISIFKIKYIVGSALLVCTALLICTLLWGPKNYSYDLDLTGSEIAYWNDGAEKLLRHLAETCWAPPLLCNSWLGRAITGRSFNTVSTSDGDIKRIGSCKGFRFPLSSRFTSDPNLALSALALEFPNCLRLEKKGDGIVDIKLRRDNLVQAIRSDGSQWLLCECNVDKLTDFKRQ